MRRAATLLLSAVALTGCPRALAAEAGAESGAPLDPEATTATERGKHPHPPPHPDTASYVPKHNNYGVAHESNDPSAHTHGEHGLGDPSGKMPAPAFGRPTAMLRGDAGKRTKQEKQEEREEGAKEWFGRAGGDLNTLLAFQGEFMALLTTERAKDPMAETLTPTALFKHLDVDRNGQLNLEDGGSTAQMIKVSLGRNLLVVMSGLF